MLAERADLVELNAGAVLYDDKDNLGALYLVLSGGVRFLLRPVSSAEFSQSGEVRKGGFFGEGAVLDRILGHERRSGGGARIEAAEDTLLASLTPEVVGELVGRHAALLMRNLLKQASAKATAASEERLENLEGRAAEGIFENILRWLSRTSLDALTTLKLNAAYLSDGAPAGEIPQIGRDLEGATAKLDKALHILSMLSGRELVRGHPHPFDLRHWWEGCIPAVEGILHPRALALDAYAETLEVVTCEEGLREAALLLVEGAASVAPNGSTIEVRAGREHGRMEFLLTFIFPGLTEFMAQRILTPFGLGEDSFETGIAFAMTRRTMCGLGGDVQLRKRSGQKLTLALSLPLGTTNP